MNTRHGMLTGLVVGTVTAVTWAGQPPANAPAPQKMEPKNEPGSNPPAAPAKPESAPSNPPATAPASRPNDPADPTKTMDDLEREAGRRPASAPLPAAAPAPGTSPSGTMVGGGATQPVIRPFVRLMREGAFLTSKRGRMAKSAEGEWLFVFDNDADSRSYPPMVIMPCLNLATMEQVAARTGDSATMTVSGQVFVYKGKNYLLPVLFVVDRKTELSPNS